MTPARAALPLALVACVLACEGKRAVVAPDAVAAAAHVEIGRSTHTPAPQPSDAAVTPVIAATTEPGDAAAAGGEAESLIGEESESDPRSDTVKIKVIVEA